MQSIISSYNQEPLASRHKAALSHLGALPLVTFIWLALLIRQANPEDEFVQAHASAAFFYQALTLIFALMGWFSRTLPDHFFSPAAASLILIFSSSLLLVTLGVIFACFIYLAIKAWNSEPFTYWLPGWLYS